MCVENHVTIDQKDKVLDLKDSLKTNPADSVRIGIDLDSIAKIIKNFVNSKTNIAYIVHQYCIFAQHHH